MGDSDSSEGLFFRSSYDSDVVTDRIGVVLLLAVLLLQRDGSLLFSSESPSIDDTNKTLCTAVLPIRILLQSGSLVCEIVHKSQKCSARKAVRARGTKRSGVNKSAFRLRPERVAKTLLQMAQQGSGFLKGSLGSGLSTPGQAAEPLFKICALAEEGFELVAFGETHHLSSAAVESSEPDPLWEHVAGICQHMEEDHSDTFEVFLKSVGVDPEGQGSITMPWIESSGFFLQLGSNSHWVPFPQECPTSQDVRKVLIKMLRELRR